MPMRQAFDPVEDRVASLRALAHLVEDAPGFIAHVRGATHVYELANRAYADLVGRAGLLGQPAREALPDAAGGRFFDLLDECYQSGRAIAGRRMEVQFARGDGRRDRYVDFLFSPTFDRPEQPSGVFIQGIDVTGQVHTERRLQESEARFRTIADAMPQMVWSTLPDGSHDYYNHQWYAFTGVPEGSTDGDGWNGVFHPDDQPRAWQVWRASLATGAPYEIEYRLRHRSGEYRWVLGRALPVRNDAGAIIRWMGTCTDVHEQKLAQRALLQSEAQLRDADVRKDEFLAMLAHELRNPLAPLDAAAHLMRSASRDPALVEECADIIGRQVRHMVKLVDDLLDVSRVTRGVVRLTMEPVDLGQVVAAAVEQNRPHVDGKHQQVVVDGADAPAWVLGDETRLLQVVSNLLSNASKFTGDGGRIGVRVARAGERIELDVTDTGIGIDAPLLPHVFDLFVQGDASAARSRGGLGIGLALAKGIVELHGGRIAARSDGAMRGATFTISLPAHAPGAGATAAPAADRAPARALSVLLVDDNVDAARTMAAVLRLTGHRVSTAHAAGDALALCQANAYDVCVLDIGLPDLTGHELAQRIAAGHAHASPRPRLVALTGYGQPHDVAMSQAAGFDRHLVKPVAPDALLRVLDDVTSD